MATPEEAIATALGDGIVGTGIVGWSNDPETGGLVLTYSGDHGINTEVIVVNIVDAT